MREKAGELETCKEKEITYEKKEIAVMSAIIVIVVIILLCCACILLVCVLNRRLIRIQLL